MNPTRSDFLAFIRANPIPKKGTGENVTFLSVTTNELADNSTEIDKALERAIASCFDFSNYILVDADFLALHNSDRSIAILNLAMHYLIMNSNLQFFQDYKNNWRDFYSDSAKNAILTSASNEASSNGFDYNDAYKNKTAFERELIKTIFGQKYYEIAQLYYPLNDVVSCVV